MMNTYLISLEQDMQRRKELERYFPKYFNEMIWIPAIYGKNLLAGDYFNAIRAYHIRHHRLITSGELGATLSHIKALESFLASGQSHALILEDDMIGGDDDLEKIMALIAQLDEKSMLLCGGQTSNGNPRFQLGKKTNVHNVLELSRFSYSYVFGACCYVVSRISAQHILESHKKYIKLADNWDLFFWDTSFKIYYTDILKHPDDRTNSHLQKERSGLAKKMSFIQRVRSGHFLIKNFNFIKNHLIIFYLFLTGYRKIR